VEGKTTAPDAYPRLEQLTQLPILVIAAHSRCNCRCAMCDIWRDRTRHEITAEQVASWMPDIRRLGVERVVLTGGEPLMHSHLWRLCDPLREAGIGITLLSTGLLLEREAAQIVRYVDDVIVSLDGPESIHDAIRNVPRAYDRLRLGIAALRAAAKDASLRISARCTVQRANAHALVDIIAAAHARRLDHISFLSADVTSEAFNRPEGWTGDRQADVLIPRDELPRFADSLTRLERECAADFSSRFIVESPEKLRRRLLWHVEAMHGLRAFPAPRCNAPWVSTVVEADGSVRPCFFHDAIANIHEAGGLDAALHGEPGRTFRRTLDVATNATCERCVCTLMLARPTAAAGAPAPPAARAEMSW
jgi:MoaA/NifB/PqqE/SkfB family radical SAM enzyme